MTSKMTRTAYLGILSILALAPLYSSGTLVMTVSPLPARVYRNAPAGVTVVTVIASDNRTGRVTTLSLESRPDARYFKIDSKGVIKTSQTIAYKVNKVFTFAVYAHQKDTTDFRQVKIIVSKRNHHAPTFLNASYNFPVYRYGVHDVIGSVSAADKDVEVYNKHFTIFAPPRQSATKYIEVDQSGELTLIRPVPDTIAMLDIKLLAVDSGSPQLTGTTSVTVDFLKVKQPDTFCFSSRATSIRLCWKNPMPDQSFRGYNVLVKGAFQRKDYVPMIAGHEEACYTLNGTVRGGQYIFKITVDSDHFWYGSDVELLFNHSGIGHHRDCIQENFSACSYLYPCSDNGRCVSKPGESNQEYTCVCEPGWQGDKCSIRNVCDDANPCVNGRCIFKDHNKYACLCRKHFLGTNCQHRNPCLQSPCGTRGTCRSLDDGTFTCDCSTGFTGSKCQDPDPCSLKPCRAGQGNCAKISGTERQCVCNPGYYGDSCEMINECLLEDTPCLANGICHNTSNSHYCECPPGTSGDRCQTRDPCHVMPCKNGGDCRPQPSGTYLCDCPRGFSGSECQLLDPSNCNDIDCNNGSCVLGPASQPRCSCSDGFFGDSCEYYDVCRLKVSLCNNHGRCISDDEESTATEDPSLSWKTEYRCDCNEPWYGLNCQHYNSCFIAPAEYCKNGGTCVPIDKKQYHCKCPAGFYEDDCSKTHPCLENPCQNGGNCSRQLDDFQCDCPEGWVGKTCQYQTRQCMPKMNPCQNGATCVLTESNPNLPVRYLQSSCICRSGYSGRMCQLYNPCHSSPCINGNCVVDMANVTDTTADMNASTRYHCNCDKNFTGSRCEVPIDLCWNISCQNGGRCYNGTCDCMPTFTGDRCQHEILECVEYESDLSEGCTCVNNEIVCHVTDKIIEGCDSEDDIKLNQSDGSIFCAKLPSVDIDADMIFRCCSHGESCQLYNPDCSSRLHCSETGVKDQTCLYFATACQGRRPCVEYSQLNMSCADLAQPGDNGWVQCASVKLEVLSSADPLDLDVADVALYGKIVEDLREAAMVNKSIAQLAMDSISKLANVNISVSQEVEAQNQTNSKLLSFIEEYGGSVQLDSTGSNDVMSDVFTVNVESLSSSEDKVEFLVETIGGKKVPMYIAIPRKVLDDRNASRVQFVGYRKSQLFISSSAPMDADIVERQAVISATVTNCTLDNLSEPVTIKLPILDEGENNSCVFWDSNESQWSTDGVTTLYDMENGQVTCISDHLTSFAVLLSPTPEAVHSEEGLTYITYVGCAISMACLAITLVTYGLFRCLHGEKSGKILLHLCTALLLLNAVFLAGTVDVSGYDQVGCTTVALLLHYLVLASLTWMLVEAVEMYHAIVTVFAKYERLYLVKRCIIAWGVPALIVAITAAVDINMYGSKRISGDGEIIQICFLSGGSKIAYYVSLLTPACLIIVINTVVFIMVARVILKPRFQQQMTNGSTSLTPAQVRGALTVMFLLGITWVFGPLAIGKATVVFSYLFCICNSLQGCLIFIFRCLFNPEARLAWTQLVKTGTLKRRRGPIKSAYTDSSSSKAGPETINTNRRLSNSTSTHLSTTYQASSSSPKTPLYNKASGSHLHPHQLHNTNGWHPNLNGWRRENGHIINNPLHTGFDLQPSCPDPGPSQSESNMAKRDLLPPDDAEDNIQDELTHL